MIRFSEIKQESRRTLLLPSNIQHPNKHSPSPPSSSYTASPFNRDQHPRSPAALHAVVSVPSLCLPSASRSDDYFHQVACMPSQGPSREGGLQHRDHRSDVIQRSTAHGTGKGLRRRRRQGVAMQATLLRSPLSTELMTAQGTTESHADRIQLVVILGRSYR
jgi:hypothetical protein